MRNIVTMSLVMLAGASAWKMLGSQKETPYVISLDPREFSPQTISAIEAAEEVVELIKDNSRMRLRLNCTQIGYQSLHDYGILDNPVLQDKWSVQMSDWQFYPYEGESGVTLMLHSAGSFNEFLSLKRICGLWFVDEFGVSGAE